MNFSAKRAQLELLFHDYLKLSESLDSHGNGGSSELHPLFKYLVTPSPEYNGFSLVDAIFWGKLGELLKKYAVEEPKVAEEPNKGDAK